MKFLTLLSALFALLLFWRESPEAPRQVDRTSADSITHCATEAFARLADDPAFRAAHELPRTLGTYYAAGNMISWPTPDGQSAQGYEVAPEEETDKVLLVIHEWWGLNDHIKQEAEKLQAALGEVRVIALDMYDGKVATTREKAGEYMQSLETARAEAIIEGVLDFVGEEAEIATIGWCFGGGWSLQSSLIAGGQSEACVIYYGMPEQDADRLARLEAPVLGIFASRDGWINPEVVETFEANMEQLDKELTVKMYEADHGFANPSSPRYNEAASQDAWAATLAFLREAWIN